LTEKDKHISLQKRYILVTGLIEEKKTEIILNKIFELEFAAPDKPILMIVDSYGGEVDSMWAIINAMQMVRCKVATVCLSKAMSAASIILLAGEKGMRFSSSNCRIMLHQFRGGFSGTIGDMDVNIEEAKRFYDESLKFIAKKTKMNLKIVKEKLQKDYYLAPKEAIEAGVIDRTIQSFKELNMEKW
jgi:ATP-dependent Clp protease protease subunit